MFWVKLELERVAQPNRLRIAHPEGCRYLTLDSGYLEIIYL